MKKIFLLIFVLITILLSGCATGPQFNTVEKTLTTIPEGQARIFFYRPSVVGAAIQPDVNLNGKVVGTAKPNGVFFVDTQAGNMTVSTSTEVEKRLTFLTKAKDTRYVRLSISLGIMVGRVVPELVDEKEALSEMSDLSFITPESTE